MTYKVGDKITYDTPLSGGAKYEAEILKIDAEWGQNSITNAYKVKILKIIKPSQNPIAPQKVGDIDYIIQLRKIAQREVRVGDRIVVKECDFKIHYEIRRVYPEVLLCKRLSGFRKGEIELFERANILAPTDFW